jgi:trafficking protein particle complex subunit 11
LSPSCNLYPDGVIDARWLAKQQELIPSIFLCFYSLTSDPSLATLHDNKIKTDIGSLRSAIHQSGYKCRLSVVILPDESASSADGIQERLDNIRKGCGLDPKSFFSIPIYGSQEELERVTDNALTTVYTQAIEYYRDLGRHARKKRARGFAPQPSVPPTSGTSQTLSLAGWNVRYDFKSAVFAEFRQEMDIAFRSYEQAYEALLGTDVLESTPSWGSRWNEMRQLSDVIATRSLRCLLWNGQTSAAVRRWQSHRDRVCDVLDRRGRGTNNYGWKAWEARWTVVMANLIERAAIAELAADHAHLFLQPEKGVVGERLPPWELLHHPGYWYLSAARHILARRALAYAIPEDDRRPPDFSPASKVANRAFSYDTYMCPEPHEEYPLLGQPGVNHMKMIVTCLTAARAEFEKRDQVRLANEVALDCAREYRAIDDWQTVFDLLNPVWHDTRLHSEGWTQIIEDVGWTLRAAAVQLDHPELVVAIDWELLDRRYSRRQDWHYDLGKSLTDMVDTTDVTVHLTAASSASFLTTSFAFKSSEGKAGQTCQAQLAITSNAFTHSTPLVLDAININFEGHVKPVVIKHTSSTSTSLERRHALGAVQLITVALQEDRDEAGDVKGHSGATSLILQPGKTMVLEMDIHLRESGDAKAVSMGMTLKNDSFSLAQAMEFSNASAATTWYHSNSTRKGLSRTNPHEIHILPRPPKLEIQLQDTLAEYYTNELINLHFYVANAEEADASVKLDAVMMGSSPPGFKLFVAEDEVDTASGDVEEAALLGIPLGVIGSSQRMKCTMELAAVGLPTAYNFTIRASYSLVTDPAIPIVQTKTFKVTLASPFEANYDLLPRLHPDPWPSLFDHESVLEYGAGDEGTRAKGLSQAWALITRYASFASEDLQVTGLSIIVKPTHEIRCRTVQRSSFSSDGVQIKPQTIEEAHFDIDAQKLSLDDRGPANLDVSFSINWRRVKRETDSHVNTTMLPVPRLGIFGSEPRVLASVSYLKDLVLLSVTIENPSNHFLTFGLTMNPSDEFAFSGGKQVTMNLLPVSRRSTTYRLLPLVRGQWIRPGLVVKDKYFQKILRAIPTEGMKLDKEGFLVWVPPEDDDEGDERSAKSQ